MDNAGLTNKIKQNAITLIILVISVIIAFNVYQGKEIEIRNLMNQKTEEEQKNTVLGQIGGLETRLDNLKNNFNSKEPKTGMERIGDLAKSAAVQIISINPAAEVVSTVYTTYPYVMSLSARDYHQIGKFISLLENSPDGFLVERLTINSDPSGVSKTITASLTVYTITINK